MKKAEIIFSNDYIHQNKHNKDEHYGRGYAIVTYNEKYPDGTLFAFFNTVNPAKPMDEADTDYINDGVFATIAMLLSGGYELDFSQANKIPE